MKILSFDHNPIENYPYWIVPTGGRDLNGNRDIEETVLPIYKATVEGLPQELDALIVASDLQGNIKSKEEVFLLGEKLPEFLSVLIAIEFPNLDTNKIGVCLCGDLYANLDKRGGAGDVKNVWLAFQKQFRWVLGVAGNHDNFGSKIEFEQFKKHTHMHYLHGSLKHLDGMHCGGVSGIIGNPDKPQRVAEQDYLKMLKKILLQQPSIVLLHQSPDYPLLNFEGNDKIRQIIEQSPPSLIFCGHSQWEIPLSTFSNGSQILNLDGRVAILTR